MWWSARGGAEIHRRSADRARGLRGPAAQGVLACGHRVQGFGLLPHRQPERVVRLRSSFVFHVLVRCWVFAGFAVLVLAVLVLAILLVLGRGEGLVAVLGRGEGLIG
jgi:hypothetical protein